MQCTIFGCKNQLIARGWCHKHYKRWQTYGDPTYVKNPRIHDMSLEERILDTIKVEHGCWIWQGSISKRTGRPRLKYQCKTTSASRASFIAFKHEIPEGLFVLHTCDNILCVNPGHLYTGTHQQNMADRVKRQTGPRGVNHYKAKLKEADILYIRASSLPSRKLSEKFYVCESNIDYIRRRVTWRHVKDSGRKRGMV